MVTVPDPATSIDIIHNAWSTALDPRIHPDEKAKEVDQLQGDHRRHRPFEWRDRFPKVNMPSTETARKPGKSSPISLRVCKKAERTLQELKKGG
jgi:hypothetical protein